MDLKIAKENNKFLICFCPKHKDLEHPNFIINKCKHNGHRKGFGYCFACGYTVLYSEKEVDKMSTRKIKSLREKQPINWHKLTTDFVISSAGCEFFYSLAAGWGISNSTLVYYQVGWTGNSWSIPMRDENEVIIGMLLRHEDDFKNCVEGSQLGLFIPHILRENRPVVICEGFSDAAVATDLGLFGIGKPSVQVGDDTILKFLKFNTIDTVSIVMDDCNKPYKEAIGQKSANKLSRLLRTNGVKNRTIFLGPDVKDLREYYNKHGREKTIQVLSL